jgi:hypothetical protein
MLAELQRNLTDRNLSKTQRERPENTHPSPTPRRVGHPKSLESRQAGLRFSPLFLLGVMALKEAKKPKHPPFANAAKSGAPEKSAAGS